MSCQVFFWVVMPCGLVDRCQCLEEWTAFMSKSLKMEVCSSEVLVSAYKSTWHQNPEDQHWHVHSHENLKLCVLCSWNMHCSTSWMSVPLECIHLFTKYIPIHHVFSSSWGRTKTRRRRKRRNLRVHQILGLKTWVHGFFMNICILRSLDCPTNDGQLELKHVL